MFTSGYFMIYILAFLDPWLRFLRFQMSDLGALSSLREIVRDHTQASAWQ